MDVATGGTGGTYPQFFTNMYVKCPFSAYIVSIFAREGATDCINPIFCKFHTSLEKDMFSER